MKCVGKVRDDISDNVAVGGHIQRIRHPEVMAVVSFEELDEETVSAVLSLEKAWPRYPYTGEAHLDSNLLVLHCDSDSHGLSHSQIACYLVFSMQIGNWQDDMTRD